jgi:tetrahydromethanopterin S-methyltransferase subunit A
MNIKRKFDDAAGRICEAILPIKQEYFMGRGKELAICTLSSTELLQEIANSDLINRIAIAGRLLSENRGIDSMIKFVLQHPDLKRIIVCGKEVRGHRAGQALLALARNGADGGGKIIGATGPYPFLESIADDVHAFRNQVEIIDMIGTADIEKLVS